MSRSVGVFLVASFASCAALVASVPDAHACGGCFAPVSIEPTVVTGHRMVLSISPTQTVLYDQIEYAGEPEDFAWVLPVKPGARIETATDAFFETLEATTQTQIVSPSISCGGNGSDGCGLGCGDSGDEGAGGQNENPVEVVHEGTVGPYETVTLSTETPGALNDWLDAHGYEVDPASQPVVDEYVAEGFDFIALRLQPGQGVRAMTPVRVVTEGAQPTIPLRMVAVGAAQNVSLVITVISEGRWEVSDFPNLAISDQELIWDFSTSSSNYASVREARLDETDGRGFLTSYAISQGAWGLERLWQNYAARALFIGDLDQPCTLPPNSFEGPGSVHYDCPDGACTDAPAGDIDASAWGCEDLSDLRTALHGLHPEDVWITRLEASLPLDALDRDLTFTAAPSQTPVSNVLVPANWENEEDACGATGASAVVWYRGRPTGGEPPHRIALLASSTLLLLLSALWMRRARRSVRRPTAFLCPRPS